jgi:alkylation response protein AidB-like acyl-CoA dehydrogenase
MRDRSIPSGLSPVDNQIVSPTRHEEYQHQLLTTAESYLRENVAPQAAVIDSDADALRAVFHGMSDRALFTLKVPLSWGGAEFSDATYYRFQELVPRYSGALAFLQTQHQSAVGMLARCENEGLKQEYLPRIVKGDRFLGIGFSQLRRKGKPLVKAAAIEGGYLLKGQVPWVTGWNYFQDFIVASVLPDDRTIFGVVPFVETWQDNGGEITFSSPMQLAAMASTNTVSAKLQHWFLPNERVVSIKPPGWIHENDKKNVLNHGFFALGCARAGLDILEATAKHKKLDFIKAAFDSLHQEFWDCRTQMMQGLSPFPSWEDKLQLRAWAIHLAQRCAHAAVTVSSGAANYAHHPAQRVYREAMVFTVFGQTTAVMEATLARLLGNKTS